jgi:hypothetical protein
MTKPGAKKTPDMLAYQQEHNRKRREDRKAKQMEKKTVPREGACEEIVSKMVGAIITRLLKRRRNTGSRNLKGNVEAQRRANECHARLKQEASDKGITITELRKQRSEKHAAKPLVFYNAMARHKERVAEDVAYKITTNLRTRLGEFIRLTNGTKAQGTMALVGCSQKDLIAHLQSQIPEGESLHNYSIDHIFPMSMYDASDPLEQKKMMNYSNLQPLKLHGVGGNISKNNRPPSKTEAAKVAPWARPKDY